mmetsp:Transcript_44796/g.136750  ORF Transcript_44796/g.136750 Transcript_44796/m.136750 type:complete len:2045 (-) Transcript_44796:355-6489(-)
MERDSNVDHFPQLAEAEVEVDNRSDGEAAYETAEEEEEAEGVEDIDFANAIETTPMLSAPSTSSSESDSESDSENDNNTDNVSDDIDGEDDDINGTVDNGRSEEEDEDGDITIDVDEEDDSGRIRLAVPSFPPLLNSASVPVALGRRGDHIHTIYCGRRLGRDAIPGSDGRCGPDDGPQCTECRDLEVGGVGRREVLRRAVPGLEVLFLEDTVLQSRGEGGGQEDNGTEEDARTKTSRARSRVDAILTLVLRQSGGLVPAALTYLKERTSGALRAVDPLNVALPPLSLSDDGDNNNNGVSDADIQTLQETLGLDPLSARLALRRHSGDVQRAAAFALDEPEELGRSIVEEREREERREREREEVRATRQRALQEACSVAGGSIKDSLTRVLSRLAREACKFDSLETELAKEGEEPAEEGTEAVEGRDRGIGRGDAGVRVFRVLHDQDAEKLDGDAFAVDGHLMVSVPPLPSDLNRAGDCAVGGRTLPCGHTCELSFPRDRESCCECSDERPVPTDERGYPRFASRTIGTVYDTRHQHYCHQCRNRCILEKEAEGAVRTCIVCAGSVPSAACGMSMCKLCRMCEGCVQSHSPQEEDEDNDYRRGQAHRCPALRNGSHLHLHPLTYGLDRRRTCHCDIGSGPGGCCDVLWSCAECDFDVCAPCMSRSAPEGYDRLTGTTVRPGNDDGSGSDSDENGSRSSDDDDDDNDSDGENSDNGDDNDENEGPGSQRVGFRPLDPVSAERLAAARWEGNAVTDPSPGENVVGTSETAHRGAFVATLSPVTARCRRGRDSDNSDDGLAERREARRRLRGEAAGSSRTETKLGEDSEEALELLRSSNGGSRISSDGNSSHGLRSHEEESTSLRSYLTAADLAHAEDLLHRARAVDGDALVRRELCRAVAGGRLDLVGSLLLSEAFAPVPLDTNMNANRCSNNGGVTGSSQGPSIPQDECWCGLPIDSLTSPDGSVGCLGGHNMHPCCASDLLLSGGSCPTCRMGLYYPRVPEAEAKVAAGLVEEEILRASRQRERGDGSSGNDSDAGVGECGEDPERDCVGGNVAEDDFVHIEGCPKKCSAVMTIDPQSGGWCEDMADSCGKVGRVTELLREGDDSSSRVIAVRVRTRNEEHTLERIRRNSEYQCKQCNMYGPSPETGRRKCSRCRLCERCCRWEDRYCPRARHEWTWATSLLQRAAAPDVLLLSSGGAGGSDPAVTALLDPEEAAARSAEGHVMRLRAELKAVAAAREGLRAKTEGLKMPWPIWIGGGDGEGDGAGLKASENKIHSQCQPPLCEESVDALRHLWGKVSLADWAWARHLLSLSQCWEDLDGIDGVSKDAQRALAFLCETVKRGDLDSAARAVRRRNVALMADRLQWEDATRSTADYVVSPTARVELRARPSDWAPRTGYVLHPETRFGSRREMLDDRGDLWIQVNPKSFGLSSSSSSSAGGGVKVVADLSDQVASRALVGARVRRGPDWKCNDQDGGVGNEGVIVQVVRSGRVAVRWDMTKGSSASKQYEYRAGAAASPASGSTESGRRKKKKHDLVFAGAAPQAPQGWLRVRPAGGGRGSPPVVWRSRSALRCFCCGDGLVPPRRERGCFSSARGADLGEGDELLVAATLEPVVVQAAAGGRARCAFVVDNDCPLENPAANTSIGQDDSFDVWYRFEDLVFPEGKGEVSEEDTVKVKGQQRTRREVVLMCDGNEKMARQMWSDAKEKPRLGKNKSEDDDMLGFASCIHGHFLHARCLQGALLAGRECPAIGCNEPLCVPRVKRLGSDDTCCGADNSGDINEVYGEKELLRTADALIQHSRLPGGPRADGDSSGMDEAGLPDLKMCPACCSGPLINQNCSDMKAHHGQCSRVAIRGSGSGERPCTSYGAFRVTPVEIAEKIKHMSSVETVTDILPLCPTHKVPVMFNGCLACGHLFTDTDWDEMPKWDPKAKSLLELDSKKRKAADLLAKQVRTEAALLEFERNQFDRFGAMCKVCTDTDSPLSSTANLPPLPPPTVKYSRRGCGPSCDLQHFQDGECLVCGCNWGVHSGHTCPGGRTRGTWEVR